MLRSMSMWTHNVNPVPPCALCPKILIALSRNFLSVVLCMAASATDIASLAGLPRSLRNGHNFEYVQFYEAAPSRNSRHSKKALIFIIHTCGFKHEHGANYQNRSACKSKTHISKVFAHYNVLHFSKPLYHIRSNYLYLCPWCLLGQLGCPPVHQVPIAKHLALDLAACNLFFCWPAIPTWDATYPEILKDLKRVKMGEDGWRVGRIAKALKAMDATTPRQTNQPTPWSVQNIQHRNIPTITNPWVALKHFGQESFSLLQELDKTF